MATPISITTASEKKTREQSQRNRDPAKEFRPRGKIRHPSRKTERAHELHVMMKPAPYLVITVRNHDHAQNKPQRKQSQGLQPVEKIHASLQSSTGYQA